jgi:hypothetical protein
MVSSLGIANIAIIAFTLLIIAYAAFWAFNIRRALPVKLYRNHALGVAVVAIGLALLDIEWVLIDAAIEQLPYLFLTLFGFFIVMFYWIDSAVLSARRADPLLRDSARWIRLRRPLWAIIVITVAFAIGSSVAGYAGYGDIFLIPFILVGVSGAVVLPLAARHSKDITLNRHLRWFGVFSIFLIGWVLMNLAATVSTAMNPATLLISPLSVTTSYLVDLVNIVGLSGGGYSLYKGARSLAPMNRIDAIETEMPPSADAVKS